MHPRWVIERKFINRESEVLQVIEVYALSESKELVKRENKKWTHERHLILA